MFCRSCARVRAALLAHRHALHWGIVHALPYSMFVLLALQTGQRAWYGAAIAAMWTALADQVGPVHARLRNMSILTCAGSLACGLGVLTSPSLPLALAAAAAIGLLAGLYGAQTSPVAQPAKLVFVAFLSAAGVPVADSATALPAMLCYAAGSMTAIACCLVLFPSEQDRRPRDEIIAMFSALAEFARSALPPDSVRADPATGERYRAAKRQLRLAIEHARQTLQAARLFGYARLEPYVGLVGLADACFRVGLLLAEDPDAPHATRGGAAATPARKDAALATIAGRYLAAMEAMDRHVRQALLPRHTAHAELRARLVAALAPLRQTSLPRPAALAQAIAALARAPAGVPAVTPAIIDEAADGPFWDLLLPRSVRAALRRDAALPQHAARIACGGAIGLAIATLLLPGHGYWLAITLVIVLTPHARTTRRSAWLRLAGSVAGAASAAFLSWADVPPGIMALLTPLFLAAAYGTRVRGQMGVFAFFLTLTVVYFSWLEHPLGSSLTFAVLRGVDTLLGCGLAIVLVLLSPRPRPLAWLARHAALALDAAALYVASVAHASAAGITAPHGWEAVHEARRARTGLAISLAEQALAANPPMARDHTIQLQQILLAARRLIGIALRLQAAMRDAALDHAYRRAAATLVQQQCSLLQAASQVLRRLPVAPLTLPGTLPAARQAAESDLEDQLLALATVSSDIMRAVTVLEELREQPPVRLAERRLPGKWLEVPRRGGA